MKVDVIFSGGGLIGASSALALLKKGLKVVIVDPIDLEKAKSPSFDGRTTAVTFGSSQFLKELGAWKDCQPHAQPIDHIKVFEQAAPPYTPWVVNFNANDLSNEPMGYIVENAYIRKALYNELEKYSNLTWISSKIKAHTLEGSFYSVELENTQTIKTSLLIGAEGRKSPLRNAQQIKSHEISYQQQGIVLHVGHEKPHHNTAFEIFSPQGPLAFLPLKREDYQEGHASGIVWSVSETCDSGVDFTSIESVLSAIQENFPYLGKLTALSQIWTYPLAAMFVKNYINDRFILLGDSAHAIHPLAGQGVNIGWMDAKVLASVLGEAFEAGVDVGNYQVLKTYERKRRTDTLLRSALNHATLRVFEPSLKPIYWLRQLGLAAVEHLPPLKKAMMKKAMGI